MTYLWRVKSDLQPKCPLPKLCTKSANEIFTIVLKEKVAEKMHWNVRFTMEIENREFMDLKIIRREKGILFVINRKRTYKKLRISVNPRTHQNNTRHCDIRHIVFPVKTT